MLAVWILAACATGGDTADTATLEPTFTNVQAEVFTPSCGFSTCHGQGQGSANLLLTEGAAYADLVGVLAEGDANSGAPPEGAVRVVPGDAASSYLVTKLSGEGELVGDVMPDPAGLDADRLALVVAWIDAGAADD